MGILDKYRADYKLSIEDFAELVNAYIVKQRPNFRLNFFVDKVGQYIADNIKLMTNLQTIAESLAKVPGAGLDRGHRARGYEHVAGRVWQTAQQRLYKDPGPLQKSES